MKTAQIQKHDWDFRDVPVHELIACCHYEYARESASIVDHYNKGAGCDSFPTGLTYTTTVQGRILTLPNPLVWIWRSDRGPLFRHSWEDMPQPWRNIVCDHYHSNDREAFDAFVSGDSPWMEPEIVSRGDNRTGIDRAAGRERLVVEIGWAGYTNKEILKSAAEWLQKHRPEGMGWADRKGREKLNSWRVKLDRLAVMRLLHHNTLCQLRLKLPQALTVHWPKLG